MKKIYVVLVISLLSTAIHAQGVKFEWAKSMGASSTDFSFSITTDASGNVYVTGYYQGTVDFDPGVLTFNLNSNGDRDGFIQKLDANGNFLWAKSMGGTGVDQGFSITTDASGNVYVTGIYEGIVDFDPSGGTYNLTSNGGYDIFVQKLDSSGNFIWAKSTGGTAWDVGRSISTDTWGNLYVTGYYQDSVDFDPSAATFSFTSNGNLDAFIQKLDTGGNFIWAKSMGGTSGDYGLSITTDAQGNVYLTGYYQDSVDFDPGAATFNLISNGSRDVFVQKLDSAGNFIWAKSIGGTSSDYGNSITTDTAGNVYVTGQYSVTVDFDPGASTFNLTSNGGVDAFVQKLDSGGNFIWAKSIGGGSSDIGRSITTDASGNVYVTGRYYSTVDFDPGGATFNLTANGSADVFIQKLDSTGNFIWAKSMGGTSEDNGRSITTDPSGNVYVTGDFQGTADFDPGAAILDLTSNGIWDIFVQKLSACAPDSGIDVITACDSYTWIDGNTYTSNNNTATHTIAVVAGCDSVATLNLTVTNSTSGTDVITACDSITWIDGNTYTSNNSTATHTLTNSAGCDSMVLLNLTIDTVDVSVTAVGPIITAKATGASYQWLDCNNNYAIIAGDTAQSFTASANGDYAVEVTDNGCTDTSVCINITNVAIEENTLFNGVSIFPNPNQGLVIIYLGNLKEVSIKVFSASGQLIYQVENINTQIHQFEFKEAPGVYFVEVSSNGEKQQYKLIKE